MLRALLQRPSLVVGLTVVAVLSVAVWHGDLRVRELSAAQHPAAGANAANDAPPVVVRPERASPKQATVQLRGRVFDPRGFLVVGAVLESGAEARAASNWATSTVFGALKARGLEIGAPANAPEISAAILAMIADGTISNSAAKQVFDHVLDSGDTPGDAVDTLGLKQVSDTGALDKAIAEVMAANPDKVAEYRGGKDKLFGFFVGQTMKATGGKANPAVINDLLKVALAG